VLTHVLVGDVVAGATGGGQDDEQERRRDQAVEEQDQKNENLRGSMLKIFLNFVAEKIYVLIDVLTKIAAF
jgi:hypothetical protein